jgi:hypothetical protein
VVLITVPFNSLRFPPREEQTWGLFFLREIPRKGELAFWPAFSTRVAGRLTQAATASGLRGIAAPRNIQLTPYTTRTLSRGMGRLSDRSVATDVLPNRIWRLRSNYQLSRQLDVRVILQRDTLRTDDRLTPFRPPIS